MFTGGLFELPGLNLDEIDIPIATVPAGNLPSPEQLEDLKKTVIDNVNEIAKNHEERSLELEQILKQIEAFKPDPLDLEQFFSERETNTLGLSGDKVGTHFIIAPVNPILPIEIILEDAKQDYSFRSQLLGFSDQVFGTKVGPDKSSLLK